MGRPPYKTISIKPIDGLLDTRRLADQVEVGSWRWVESWEVTERGKLCRMSGYRRLLEEEFNNNADAHDQLLAIAGRTMRQPIVFLHEHPMASGAKKFFLATANTLYALNNSTGNYKVIGNAFSPVESTSCQEVGWSAGGFGDVAVFSNGVDPAVYHVIDQPVRGVANQSVQPIPDLALLKVTRVGLVKQWAGITFYANVVQDGTRKSYRVLWSDYQNPISIKPKASASVAGFKDLDFGEVILAAAPIGNSMLWYTNLGIWISDVSSSGVTWSKRYAPDENHPKDRCLSYPRTLVSTGSEHYYMANDGIYLFSLYVPRPQRIDWIHKASAVMYDDLDSRRCQVHCAGYEVLKKQLWFSWAKQGQGCAQQSLVINTEFPFVSIVPKGFTAFGNLGFIRQKSVREFLLERCICDAAGLDSHDLGFVMEGGYCAANPEVVDASGCSGAPPTVLFTHSTVNLDGVLVEDMTQQTAASDSLCAQLGGLTVADICSDEQQSDQCKPFDTFVMASSDDFCLKQTDPQIAYRERCTDFTGCGGYLKEGYRSPLRSGPLDLNLPEQEKILARFGLQLYPVAQTVPSQVTLKIGGAGSALDPNTFDDDQPCAIMYQQQKPQPLACQGKRTAREHRAMGTREDGDLAWVTWWPGKFLYFEIDIVNPTAAQPDTGGLCCLSSITFRVLVQPETML